jgi:hypothetical protein
MIKKIDYTESCGNVFADLDHSVTVRLEHISEAVQYKNLDRDLWK